MGPGPNAPTVYVAWKADDLSTLVHFLNTEHQQRVAKVDFSSYVILAVFAGSKGSSGHAITVQQVSIEAGKMRVVVALGTPAPTENVLAAFTNPYHVVQVPRAGFGGSIPSSWIMLDNQGNILAAGNDDQQ